MKFDFEGLSYTIEFERSHKVLHRKEKDDFGVTREITFDSRYPYTTAKIYRVDPVEGQKPALVLVREYTVGCKNDEYKTSYESGRKAALRMALYDAPIQKSNGSGVPQLGIPCSEAFRKAAWDAYHYRDGGILAKAHDRKVERAEFEAWKAEQAAK